jgi:hypothetical protein
MSIEVEKGKSHSPSLLIFKTDDIYYALVCAQVEFIEFIRRAKAGEFDSFCVVEERLKTDDD